MSCVICGHKHRRKLNGTPNHFYCEICLGGTFPFNGITNNREFKDTLVGFSLGTRQMSRLTELRFNPLEGELKEALAEYDLSLSGCDYYDEDQFLKLKEKFSTRCVGQFSLLSFNINSLPRKIDQFESLLGALCFKLDIIGITETHLNDVSAKFATLEGYDSVKNCRIKDN